MAKPLVLALRSGHAARHSLWRVGAELERSVRAMRPDTRSGASAPSLSAPFGPCGPTLALARWRRVLVLRSGHAARHSLWRVGAEF